MEEIRYNLGDGASSEGPLPPRETHSGNPTTTGFSVPTANARIFLFPGSDLGKNNLKTDSDNFMFSSFEEFEAYCKEQQGWAWRETIVGAVGGLIGGYLLSKII